MHNILIEKTLIFIWAPKKCKFDMVVNVCMLIFTVCNYLKYIPSLPQILYDSYIYKQIVQLLNKSFVYNTSNTQRRGLDPKSAKTTNLATRSSC
jgi:hypothetical protein